jgi:hypothetical protein
MDGWMMISGGGGEIGRTESNSSLLLSGNPQDCSTRPPLQNSRNEPQL